MMDELLYEVSRLQYTKAKPLGNGASACVLSARCGSTRVALKCIYMQERCTEWNSEKDILAQLQHPNILELRRVIPTKKFGILETELMDIDLMTVIETKLPDEMQLKMLFHQICTAVGYCHQKGIAHLDLKPENILLNSSCEIAKLADFGSAVRFTKGVPQNSCRVGTFFYCAPELICGREFLPDKADIWSLGILLYTLVTGSWPFASGTQEEIYLQVASGKVLLSSRLSDDLKSLFFAIFQLDSPSRPTIDEILEHPWFSSLAAPRRKRFSVVFSQTPSCSKLRGSLKDARLYTDNRKGSPRREMSCKEFARLSGSFHPSTIQEFRQTSLIDIKQQNDPSVAFRSRGSRIQERRSKARSCTYQIHSFDKSLQEINETTKWTPDVSPTEAIEISPLSLTSLSPKKPRFRFGVVGTAIRKIKSRIVH